LFSERLNIPVDKDKIVEGIVGSKIKNKDMLSDVFFTKVKKEIDFVLPLQEHGKKGVEVKYQNNISREDFVNKRFFKKYVLLSKSVFEDNTIPVYVYLFVKQV
jgi:predicted AAA+ superfamily ATPase